MKRLLLLLALGIFIAIPSASEAAECSLSKGAAYSTPDTSSVYYITDD